MNVLGIETSCDETSASIVKDGRKVISNVISSSEQFHKKYGGIIPEIAFRMQLEAITGVVNCAVEEAGITTKGIGLISVTENPGLIGSLLTGMSFAQAISFGLGTPMVKVNHLYSHIYAAFLEERIPRFPLIALVVSGGHTSLFYLKDFNTITLLGSTHDDACGEAFDKVAKILGLGYPGGPVIEQMSKKGNPHSVKFGCSKTKNEFDFSFSGIKTAVLYFLQKNSRLQALQPALRADICASFQETAINTLIEKTLLACKIKKIRNFIVAGGVAANNRLREKFFRAAEENNLKCFFPAQRLCTDNAAMVAGLGFQVFKKGR
ncbi:MAG: tRNA (adenosine(37)-N6)-threonylcarbamoyltransferase complex transferase subunit TsaD [Candidatus Omnitrophota bacterium]|jgi:N6-L-threonylcarbamoyladenine synthase